MALPGFGVEAQERLRHARVLLVGIGGLGCPAAQYLAASGVGTLGLADDDRVSERNLHRQILFTPADVGLSKVDVAARRLRAQNPGTEITPHPIRVTSANVMSLIEGYDLVIEGTDNFETKYLLNDACVLAGKPLVYGAIYQYEGQAAIWNVLQEDGTYSPNYRDVFPDAASAEVPDCSSGGVLPTLAGMVGCMQANEAIKYLTGSDALLAGRLWIFNTREGTSRVIRLRKQGGARITGLTETIPTVTMEDLRRIGDYQLIDVRSRHEHDAFHIGGSNIPLEELADCLEDLNASRPVVCYCSSGKRSVVAARLIRERFPAARVYSLSGGTDRIKAAMEG